MNFENFHFQYVSTGNTQLTYNKEEYAVTVANKKAVFECH